ncbi:uncharacterized protein LOC132716329, partial [Ruditapes philippinarum]|uniref:uncharacterized protein LOC132716329 n=1 Tax=Ruditapes philippinarum TaxID=129788 RepID=UPI00295A6538
MDLDIGFFLLMFYYVAAAKDIRINDTTVPTVPTLTNATEINGQYVYPCYASVVVYKSPELKDTYSKGATVYAVTRERSDKNMITGFSSSKTDNNGHACVLTLCRKEAILYVETGSKSTGNLERLYAAPIDKQPILPQYVFEIHTRMEEIYFNVRSWGTILGKSGPVYNEYELDQCLNAGTKNYHFSYSFLAQKESLITDLPLTTYGKQLSWYDVPENAPGSQACFMKIKVKILSYQSVLQLNSYNNDWSKRYGSFIAGPKASPSGDSDVKAACMEFRCTANGFGSTKLNGSISFPKEYCCNI